MRCDAGTRSRRAPLRGKCPAEAADTKDSSSVSDVFSPDRATFPDRHSNRLGSEATATQARKPYLRCPIRLAALASRARWPFLFTRSSQAAAWGMSARLRLPDPLTGKTGAHLSEISHSFRASPGIVLGFFPFSIRLTTSNVRKTAKFFPFLSLA